jgi:hypothetical protein
MSIPRSGAILSRELSRTTWSSIRRTPLSYSHSSRRRFYHNSTAHSDADDAVSCRGSSSSTPQNYPPCAIEVPPPPSWSIHELRLTSSSSSNSGDTISQEELATLARRCLIDIRYLSPERREELREQVGGIMRCASVLLESRHLNSRKDGRDVVDDDDVCQSNGLTDEEVYDSPRGLTKMPIRSENEDDNDWKCMILKKPKLLCKIAVFDQR